MGLLNYPMCHTLFTRYLLKLREREKHTSQKCTLQGVFACVHVEDRKNHALFTRCLLKLGEREKHTSQKCSLQGVFACVRMEDRKNHALFTRCLLKLGEREKHTSQKCALQGVCVEDRKNVPYIIWATCDGIYKKHMGYARNSLR
jgi:hypothetical protein